MKLEHRFTIPVTRPEAWSTLLDIARVAQCFPGAALESVEGDQFTGNVRLKLGPISMTYAGTAAFVDKDEASHTLKVDATGRDKRGAGTARALVTAVLQEDAHGGTTVLLATDLAITGKPAQFGRGVIEEVSNKLLDQFAANLQRSLSGPAADPARAASGHAGSPGHRAATQAPSGPTEAPQTQDASLNMLSPAILVPLGKRLLPAVGAVAAGLLLVRARTRRRQAGAPIIIYIEHSAGRPSTGVVDRA